MPKDLRPLEGRQAVSKAVAEVKKRFPEGIALLDPIENMGIKDPEFLSLLKVRFLGLLPSFLDLRPVANFLFFVVPRRKSKPLRNSSSTPLSTRLLNSPPSTPSTPSSLNRPPPSELSRRGSRRFTTFFNSTSSRTGNESFVGWDSLRRTTLSR